MTMDPRIAERRRDVAEDRARLDVRRVVWFLVLLASIGSAIWLATSPMLSVQTINIFGATNAQVSEALVEQRVEEGRPLVLIRAGSVAEAIELDPWVRTAGVELVFPSHVEVTVEEREAVAWVPLGPRWAKIADDGVFVAYADDPDATLPRIQIFAEDAGLGERPVEDTVLGSVVFLTSLEPDLAAQTTLRLADDGMWAFVGDRNVRLGRPIDMDAKAAAVMAIIESAPPGVIDVIAPSRPAVWGSEEEAVADGADPQQEGEGESVTDG